MRTLKDLNEKDVERFQVFDLNGKLRCLKDIISPSELQILLVREWHLSQAVRDKIQAMMDVCDLADTLEARDMEIED